ncbi:MAG: transposase [Nitrospirae bacterium]|nr:transposase [Nitrospirota bacterium]
MCDVGCKVNSHGYKETWRGFKLHIDATDSGLPVTVVLTSASLHDSQAAIPMIKMTTEKVTYLYDLMDSAYDAGAIYAVSKGLGHVPIIDKNPRRGNVGCIRKSWGFLNRMEGFAIPQTHPQGDQSP